VAQNVSNNINLQLDVFLYTFIVPILPYILESRLGLDVSLTQRLSFTLLAESAIASLICSPFIGHYADKLSSKKTLLLWSLAAALVSTVILALATSSMCRSLRFRYRPLVQFFCDVMV
jgi:MFS family permease